MQGKKQLEPKILYTITLEQLVPADNFYRRLNKAIDLNWLYKNTRPYYGTEGQAGLPVRSGGHRPGSVFQNLFDRLYQQHQ